MRKILIILFCALCLAAHAQHQAFMGIPLNGTIDAFTLKLKNKGIKFISTQQGIRKFRGTFAGEQDATIGISFNDKTKIVYGACVTFSVNDSSTATRLLTKFSQEIPAKYHHDGFDEVNKEDLNAILYTDCGFISLMAKITDEAYISSVGICTINIVYVDNVNYAKHQEIVSEDY